MWYNFTAENALPHHPLVFLFYYQVIFNWFGMNLESQKFWFAASHSGRGEKIEIEDLNLDKILLLFSKLSDVDIVYSMESINNTLLISRLLGTVCIIVYYVG